MHTDYWDKFLNNYFTHQAKSSTRQRKQEIRFYRRRLATDSKLKKRVPVFYDNHREQLAFYREICKDRINELGKKG